MPTLIFVLLLEIGFHRVGQSGFELLASSNSLALASQSAGITGLSHRTRPCLSDFMTVPLLDNSFVINQFGNDLFHKSNKERPCVNL